MPANPQQTPVTRTFVAIRDRLALGESHDPETLAFLEAELSTLWVTAQQEARQEHLIEIAQRLDDLGDGRLDYVAAPHPQTGDDIYALNGTQAMIYGEATGAKWLARILRGETDDRGWLPSWRWARTAAGGNRQQPRAAGRSAWRPGGFHSPSR